jgi:hypothetical protein
MNRAALIEAMARAMYEADEGPWGDALMKEMRRYATAAIEAIAPAIRAEGIYIASKTVHAARWRDLRAQGLPIISTWIDEAEIGATGDWPDLWHR